MAQNSKNQFGQINISYICRIFNTMYVSVTEKLYSGDILTCHNKLVILFQVEMEDKPVIVEGST